MPSRLCQIKRASLANCGAASAALEVKPELLLEELLLPASSGSSMTDSPPLELLPLAAEPASSGSSMISSPDCARVTDAHSVQLALVQKMTANTEKPRDNRFIRWARPYQTEALQLRFSRSSQSRPPALGHCGIAGGLRLRAPLAITPRH